MWMPIKVAYAYEIRSTRKHDRKQKLPSFSLNTGNESRKSFGKALAHHEGKLKDNMDKVLRWRETLTKAANLSGWSFLANGPEYKFIQKIVEDISVQVLDSTHLNVAQDFRQPETPISRKCLQKKFEIVCKFLGVLYCIIFVVFWVRLAARLGFFSVFFGNSLD
ncbi:uncharacterized protein LOC125476968 isoform X2 [Pyrus x bretschneideri]|uniref:uncharacterized protein LOC125476968 isoform X2 n=1 Tax=Pyrus x bretschneideri TaxID=225117 RepID=UPI0020302B60|nr:uncharacterized protein LOC125476968 isoform X2 [Pyrus x bretschneideri]